MEKFSEAIVALLDIEVSRTQMILRNKRIPDRFVCIQPVYQQSWEYGVGCTIHWSVMGREAPNFTMSFGYQFSGSDGVWSMSEDGTATKETVYHAPGLKLYRLAPEALVASKMRDLNENDAPVRIHPGLVPIERLLIPINEIAFWFLMDPAASMSSRFPIKYCRVHPTLDIDATDIDRDALVDDLSKFT